MPQLTGAAIKPAYGDLLASLPDLPKKFDNPADFDWAMHPGGATILSGAEKTMGISAEHMRASYDTYMKHGNSSSATIFSVMNRLREKEMDALAPGGRVSDHVVGCAFGPGITVEMCMLKRNLSYGQMSGARMMHGLSTPPETDSEGASDSMSESHRSSISEPADGWLTEDEKQFVADELEKLDLD